MKLFPLKNIFNYQRGERLIELDQLSGDVAYISSTKKHNGVSSYITPPEKMTYHKNKMTLSNSGSVGYCFYHEYEFVASDHVTVIWIKDESVELNQNIALYLKPILESIRYKFNFGREISNARLEREYILLPVNEKDEPDWKYMENEIEKYTKKIRFDTVNTNNKVSIDINTDEWEYCDILELFTYKRGDRLIESNRINGKIPFVTAGAENTGVSSFVSEDIIEIFNDAITIDMFANVFYRPYNFGCDDNIIVLEEINYLSKYVKIFIATVLNMESSKYSYGRQYRMKHIQNQKIKLPYNKDKGAIDFDYMEHYIRSLPYVDKI